MNLSRDNRPEIHAETKTISFKSFSLLSSIFRQKERSRHVVCRARSLTGEIFSFRSQRIIYRSIDIAPFKIPISYNLSREEAWTHRLSFFVVSFRTSIAPSGLLEKPLSSRKRNHAPCIASVQLREASYREARPSTSSSREGLSPSLLAGDAPVFRGSGRRRRQGRVDSESYREFPLFGGMTTG
ncbi:unnamed protein product [Lasius platythorax]|uniref:Uncharacterized protein n=1 Tax=Lasius platythorax TaxID=488582 RepID=A0AAV2NPP8_9HYME